MEQDPQPEAYLVHVWIRQIHPMLWRRFVVRSDRTLADLHFVLQIGFAWTDCHLHRFRIRKKESGRFRGVQATTDLNAIGSIRRDRWTRSPEFPPERVTPGISCSPG